MGKDKPRHNPNKPQNCRQECFYYETSFLPDGELIEWCFLHGFKAIEICKGNRHNCCKVKYNIAASRSDIQKLNDVDINR